MDEKLQIILEYDSESRIEYVKKALPGSKETEPVWQIIKLFYEGSTNKILKLSYANNSTLYEYVANNYLLYKYTPVYETIVIPTKILQAGFIFDLTTSTINYTVEGDPADLLNTEALFNIADFITIKEGERVIPKESVAVWQSQTSLKINETSEKGVSIKIIS